MEDTKVCPYCAETVKKIANVCRFCGRDLPNLTTEEKVEELMICPFCAETIKKESIVCRYCGRDLPPSKTEEDEKDHKICPFCAETIKKEANVCRHCRRDLPTLTIEDKVEVQKRCPYCAETINKESIVCRYCGRDVPNPIPEEKVDEATEKTSDSIAMDDAIEQTPENTLEEMVKIDTSDEGINNSVNVSDNNETVDDTKICPFCAEIIKKVSIVCMYCDRDLPSPEKEPDILEIEETDNVTDEEAIENLIEETIPSDTTEKAIINTTIETTKVYSIDEAIDHLPEDTGKIDVNDEAIENKLDDTKDAKTDVALKNCPVCAKSIDAQSLVCKYCGSNTSEVNNGKNIIFEYLRTPIKLRNKSESSKVTKGEIIGVIALVVFALVFIIKGLLKESRTPFFIYDFECYESLLGNGIIEGTVKNNTTTFNFHNVIIGGTIYAENGEEVDTITSLIDSDRLYVGETSSFYLTFVNPENNWTECSVWVEDFSLE